MERYICRRGFSCLHADRTNHPQPQPAGHFAPPLSGRENEASTYAVILRIRSVVEGLPRIFTYKQIKEKALTEGISLNEVPVDI